MAKRRSSRKKSNKKSVKRRSARAPSRSNAIYTSSRRAPPVRVYEDDFVTENIVMPPYSGRPAGVRGGGSVFNPCEDDWQYYDYKAKKCLTKPNWKAYDVLGDDGITVRQKYMRKCADDNYQWNEEKQKCIVKDGWDVYDPQFGWRKACDYGKVYDWKTGNCVFPEYLNKKDPLPRPAEVLNGMNRLQMEVAKGKLLKNDPETYNKLFPKTSTPKTSTSTGASTEAQTEDAAAVASGSAFAFRSRKRRGGKSKSRGRKRRSMRSKRRSHFMF